MSPTPSDKHPVVRVRGAAAIELGPLTADAFAYQLDLEDGVAAARWQPVIAALKTQGPLAQVLSTPLMSELARAIYSPRPGGRPYMVPDPAELCTLPNRWAIESHLLDAFIATVYPIWRDDSSGGRWPAGQAGRWLEFLAQHLERDLGRPDLAWWEISSWVPGPLFGLTSGLFAGVAAGVVGTVAAGYLVGVLAGLAAGLPVMLGLCVAARRVRPPVSGIVFRGTGLPIGLAAGLPNGFIFGPWAGVAVGLVTGLGYGLKGAPARLWSGPSPAAALSRDRKTALRLLLGVGLAIGAATGLACATAFGVRAGLTAGIAAGLTAGLTISGFQSASPRFAIARSWLALRNRLPWRLMTFLTDAHRRGVLRQSGAVYQFRHAELQRRIVELSYERQANLT